MGPRKKKKNISEAWKFVFEKGYEPWIYDFHISTFIHIYLSVKTNGVPPEHLTYEAFSPLLSLAHVYSLPFFLAVFFLRTPFYPLLATGSSGSDWQLVCTEDEKGLEPPQLDPVLIYTPTGSTDSPFSTPAGSMDSESYEARDRLLSRSPRVKPSVFTVSKVSPIGCYSCMYVLFCF